MAINGECFFDEIPGAYPAVNVPHLFRFSREYTGGGLSYNLPGMASVFRLRHRTPSSLQTGLRGALSALHHQVHPCGT